MATVETGSISAASLRCHVAQPSITMAVSKLEAELKCKLFHRHRKGSSPTSGGDRLYVMASELLLHADSIKQQFTDVKQVQTVTLSVEKNIRINSLEMLLTKHEGLLSTFQFEIVSRPNTVESTHNIDRKEADIRLTTAKQCHKSEKFISLGVEEYALLIPNNNVLAHQTKITLNDLNHQKIIERIHCENQALFDQLILQHALTINSVAKVESEEWAHALAGAGLGLVFAPVPRNFTDSRFTVRFVSDIFALNIPEREVGLAVPKTELARLKQLAMLEHEYHA